MFAKGTQVFVQPTRPQMTLNVATFHMLPLEKGAGSEHAFNDL